MSTAVQPVAAGEKVFFLGNCQAVSLQRALQARSPGQAAFFAGNHLSSPSTYLSHPDVIPEGLIERFSTPLGQALLESRTLENQFQLIPLNEPAPRAIILTLFHEATPLYQHKKEKYILFVSKAARKQPDYHSWLTEHFDPFQPDPFTYLDRYALLLEALRKRYPHTLLLLVKRSRNLAAYAPLPISYLSEWQRVEQQFEDWINTQKDLPVLDMDRVVGGIMKDTGLTANKIFPFLRSSEKQRPSNWFKFVPYFNLPVSRDIEHPISLYWDTLARYVEQWLQQGEIRYRPEDRAPHWSTLIRQYRDSVNMDEALLRKGDLGAWAGVWECLLLHPERERWNVIERYAAYFPADKVLFRALRTVLDLHPTRMAVPFLEGHRDAVMNSSTEDPADAIYLAMLQQCIDRQKLEK